VRLFWDFYGPRAEGTARHFEKHLREFFTREGLPLEASGAEEAAASHWYAYCDVDDATADPVRRALRPQREE